MDKPFQMIIKCKSSVRCYTNTDVNMLVNSKISSAVKVISILNISISHLFTFSHLANVDCHGRAIRIITINDTRVKNVKAESL